MYKRQNKTVPRRRIRADSRGNGKNNCSGATETQTSDKAKDKLSALKQTLAAAKQMLEEAKSAEDGSRGNGNNNRSGLAEVGGLSIGGHHCCSKRQKTINKSL